MADVQDQITVKNLQVEYDHLTREIPKKASELSLIYKDIEKAKSDLNELNVKREAAKAATKKEHDKLESIKSEIEQRKRDDATEIATLKGELQSLDRKHKEATHSLVRANEQILAAQNELAAIEKKMKEGEETEKQLYETIINLKKAQSELDVLYGEARKVKQEISTEIGISEVKLKEARDELSKLVYLAEEKKKEASQAEYRVKAYTDQLYTHMNDYQIVKSRLEEKWKTSFPELELPLH